MEDMKRPVGRLQRLCSQLAQGACMASPRAEVQPPTQPATVAEEEKEAEAFRRYCQEGKARALALGNRGPIRFDEDGKLAKDILDAYWEVGFYVFEGVVSEEEVLEFRKEFEAALENAPVKKGSETDRHGRPVLRPWIYEKWAGPLSDPFGESKFGIPNWTDGKVVPRHQLKMREPTLPKGALAEELLLLPQEIVHPLGYMDAALRVYGHPSLLRVAEAVNGSDFTPFGERLYYKRPRIGTSTAWHQDPSAAWNEAWSKPDFDVGTCGFNFHLSLDNCTPENGLWMVPGSHRGGRKDIKALSAMSGGTDRLKGAVPMICQPGDV